AAGSSWQLRVSGRSLSASFASNVVSDPVATATGISVTDCVVGSTMSEATHVLVPDVDWTGAAFCPGHGFGVGRVVEGDPGLPPGSGPLRRLRGRARAGGGVGAVPRACGGLEALRGC